MKDILFLGIGVIAACTQHTVTTNSTKAGPTQVFLIDAPFPYDQVARVDVYIVRVAAGTSADTTDADPGVHTGHQLGWIPKSIQFWPAYRSSSPDRRLRSDGHYRL